MFVDTVSVGPTPADSAIIPRHYGSAYAMADFTNTSHNVYLTASFLPTAKLSLTGTAAYNLATAEYGAVNFDEAEIRSRLGGDLTEQNYDFSHMPTYSKLDYGLLMLLFGLEYRFLPGVVWTADLEYRDLTDDAAVWVYGNESGSMFIGRTGVRVNF